MAQLPFGSSPRLLRARDDHGPVGQGSSRAHHVLAEDGNEYFIKGPAFNPEHPREAANELIAAGLANAVGLPVLPHAVLEMAGQIFFGRLWLRSYAPRSTYSQIVNRALLAQCENRDKVYALVAFDAWLINQDRWEYNLMVQHLPGPAGDDRHRLIAVDHGDSLFARHQPPESLLDQVGALPGGFVQINFLREAIEDPVQLSAAIAAIEGLDDQIVRGVVQSVPDELLSAADRDLAERFLIERRSRLRTLFEGARDHFPNLRSDTR